MRTRARQEATIGLFSFLGGLLGGGAQKKASRQATDAMVGAFNRGIDQQQQFFDTTRQDYMPYTKAGVGAVGKLSDLTGLNGDDTLRASLINLKDDPRYTTLFRNGEEALLQNASATGGIRGGNTQRGLADFGSDTLAKVYDMVLSQYGGMANLGLGAQGTVTNAGQHATDNITNLTGEIGGAQANNYLARGRINAQMWGNAGSFLDQAASAIAGGFGAPGGFSLQNALKAIGG